MSASLPLSALLAAAVAVVAGWFLAMDLFLRDRLRMQRRLSEKFGSARQSAKSSLFKDLKFLHAEATRGDVGAWQRLRWAVEQSGVPIAPERLVQLSAAAGIGAGLLTAALASWWVFALPAAACIGAMPLLYVSWKRQSRLRKLCQQLPDAFELMSRAVKAGQTMSSAMQMVAQSGKPPLSLEFASCCEQENLGLPLATALQDMARRTGVIELQFFVVAMLVQRQAGGNPVEILNNLSGMIRKRMRLVARVKALTGEGRMQAVVLSVLPVLAFAALYVLNRSYAEALVSRPWLLGSVLASEVIGTLWIRRIVNFDF